MRSKKQKPRKSDGGKIGGVIDLIRTRYVNWLLLTNLASKTRQTHNTPRHLELAVVRH